MKFKITPEAEEQIRSIERWWRRNRPASPKLFSREMAEARRLLGRTPEVGLVYQERQGVLVRRVFLTKTRNHVYYEVDRANGVIAIIAVWGGPKSEGPEL